MKEKKYYWTMKNKIINSLLYTCIYALAAISIVGIVGGIYLLFEMILTN